MTYDKPLSSGTTNVEFDFFLQVHKAGLFSLLKERSYEAHGSEAGRAGCSLVNYRNNAHDRCVRTVVF